MSLDNATVLFENAQASLRALQAFLDASLVNVNIRPVLSLPPGQRSASTEAIHGTISHLETLHQHFVALHETVGVGKATIGRQLGWCRFALSPISALPENVVREVMALAVLPPARSDEPETSASDLAGVCSLWRRIALGHYSLWESGSVSSLTAGRLPLTLERSRNTLRRLVVADPWTSDGTLPPRLIPVLPTIAATLRSLEWRCTANAQPFLFDAKAFPALRSLSIIGPASFGLLLRKQAAHESEDGESDDEGDEDAAADAQRWILFRDVAFPELQELRLENVDLSRIGTLNAPKLSHLYVANARAPPFAFEYLLSDVQDTLEHLEVSSIIQNLSSHEYQMHSEQGYLDFDDYKLERLHTLVCKDLPISVAIYFLNSSHYPNIKRLDFTDATPEAVRSRFPLEKLGPNVRLDLDLLCDLDNFFQECPSLEHVRLRVSQRFIAPLVWRLGKTDSSVTLPSLRTLELDLLSPPKLIVGTHAEDQKAILKFAATSFEARLQKMNGHKLERIVLCNCAVNNENLRALRSHVEEVEVRPCSFDGCQGAVSV